MPFGSMTSPTLRRLSLTKPSAPRPQEQSQPPSTARCNTDRRETRPEAPCHTRDKPPPGESTTVCVEAPPGLITRCQNDNSEWSLTGYFSNPPDPLARLLE